MSEENQKNQPIPSTFINENWIVRHFITNRTTLKKRVIQEILPPKTKYNHQHQGWKLEDIERKLSLIFKLRPVAKKCLHKMDVVEVISNAYVRDFSARIARNCGDIK